jgi:tRNA-splicing ligase RtcB
MDIRDFAHKKIKIYGEELIDGKALAQFWQCMAQPFSVQGAAMPDMHYGFTMPIGGVIRTLPNYVVPSWVGYDIGCGVCMVTTSYDPAEVMALKKEVYAAIKHRVPVGFNHHDSPVVKHPTSWELKGQDEFWTMYNMKRGDCQLGTMGGNNHFIEIGTNLAGQVCFVIHSGSRGIGHGVASKYMRLASPTGKASEGSFPLCLDQQVGLDYVDEMGICLEWALYNRRTMLMLIRRAFESLGLVGDIYWGKLINKTHNHMEERIDGNVHRKGATSSYSGERGVIPGNPKAGSYVVEGRGNADALYSSSHGAGRIGSRKEAKATMSLEDFQNDMDGIVADTGAARLDEAPKAYKNPFDVMAAQADLVKIIDHVKPFICVKG